MQAEEIIPSELRPAAEAAVSWINDTQQRKFELTGLVDFHTALRADDAALRADADTEAGYEFGLVLCDGEICAREQVRVRAAGDGYQFSLVDEAARDIPPLLDPPAGIRQQWLTDELAKHEFVLLLFYRGLW